MTFGIDHVGLTVRSLKRTLAFFTECLGWEKVGERAEYPAAFVSDGRCLVTLWEAREDKVIVEFNRQNNIGLHHIAFKVGGESELEQAFEKVAEWPGVIVEFKPEALGTSRKKHFMIREPSGVRVEFIAEA
jgi:catechol 2,3-dioxygenase-like lactoylglutathione lyase family enzyme